MQKLQSVLQVGEIPQNRENHQKKLQKYLNVREKSQLDFALTLNCS